MRFFRVVPWDSKTNPRSTGVLAPPRRLQGSGRHDNIDLYTSLYCALNATACVSEAIQNFDPLDDSSLMRAGKRLHLFQFDFEGKILDADDPTVLTTLGTRPSRFATRTRAETQPIARRIFNEGYDGLLWWSTIEASWINATIFTERAAAFLQLSEDPRPLSMNSPEIVRAKIRE